MVTFFLARSYLASFEGWASQSIWLKAQLQGHTHHSIEPNYHSMCLLDWPSKPHGTASLQTPSSLPA
eukprot:1148201-Pelagomonas_calceolata.AAC.1